MKSDLIFGKAYRNTVFNERFLDRPNNGLYLKQLVITFYENGSMQNKKGSWRSTTAEKKQVDILSAFVNNPSSSNTTVALNCKISQLH